MLPSALLFLLPVVVVDVTGDRLDPTHTRKLVEHELAITAVAPDDPRAAEATGHIEIASDANRKKLTVKYRKLDEPIERSIALPEDRARAETDAAFLAGNLARDEAGELAPSEPNSKSGDVAAALRNDADRELAQLHAFLKQTASDEKSSQIHKAAVELTAGAALLGAVTVISLTDQKSKEAETAANAAAGVGGALLGAGIGGFLFHQNPLQPLEERLKEEEKRGAAPAEILAAIDREWADKANDARRARFYGGAALLGVGAILAGVGTAIVMANAGDTEPPSGGFALIGGGAFGIVGGMSALVGESPLERSYRMWKTVRATPELASGPSFAIGVGPLPGGGGGASFALRF
jgi:hypothetical protein